MHTWLQCWSTPGNSCTFHCHGTTVTHTTCHQPYVVCSVDKQVVSLWCKQMCVSMSRHTAEHTPTAHNLPNCFRNNSHFSKHRESFRNQTLNKFHHIPMTNSLGSRFLGGKKKKEKKNLFSLKLILQYQQSSRSISVMHHSYLTNEKMDL